MAHDGFQMNTVEIMMWRSKKDLVILQGAQRRMVLVVNLFVFLKLSFFAFILIHVT